MIKLLFNLGYLSICEPICAPSKIEKKLQVNPLSAVIKRLFSLMVTKYMLSAKNHNLSPYFNENLFIVQIYIKK